MKLELSDGVSNNSDFSDDSRNSQISTADFMVSMGNGVLSQSSNFLNFEGYSGVPTRTTPTLTPTTLRNIEQTFIELQSETESHENEAGFVPPLVHPIGNNQYIPASEADVYNKSALWQPSLSQSSSSDSSTRPTPPVTPKSSPLGGGGGSGGSSGTPAPQGRRNMGGRKPAKELHLSPEEEERRRIRRERNKAAAARCRKRRVDHTNSLVEEVDRLEQKKQELQDELKRFQQQKDELELFLESHANSSRCYLGRATPPDVKPYGGVPLAPHERVKTECSDLDDDCFPPPPKRLMLCQGTAVARPPRPRTLDVHRIKASHDLPGISIATPSAGIQFNFDSLMVGGTGLTPVSAPLAPTCSTQIRIPPVSSADMTSPDSCGPPKLVSL